MAMSVPSRDWTGIQTFPTTTQTALASLLNQLREKNLEEITILLLGKSGVGKSSTVNSIFGERVCPAGAFAPDTSHPVLVSRRHSGFVINVIDTPGLVETGAVHEQNLARIREFCKNKTINVMLYVERLDAYRVDNLDRQVMKEISRTFGSQIWNIAALVLTHAQLTPCDGTSFADFVSYRGTALRKAMQQQAGLRGGDVQPATLLVENSSRCARNENDEKVVPNGDVWLVKLVEEVVNISTRAGAPLVVNQRLIDGPDANNRGKWFIPLLVVFQYFLIVRPLQKAIRDDTRMEWDSRAEWEESAARYVSNGYQTVSLRRQEELKRRSKQRLK